MSTNVLMPVFEDDQIHTAILLEWYKNDGDLVKFDEELCEIEANKVSFYITCPSDGMLKILTPQGETVPVGTVIAKIIP